MGSAAPDPVPSRPAGWAIGLLACWLALLAWQSWVHLPVRLNLLPLLVDFTRFLPGRAALVWAQVAGTLGLGALLAGFFLWAYGAGRWLLARFFPGARSRLDDALFSLALGFTALSLVIFALGLAGAYRTSAFAIIFFGGAAFGAWRAWADRGRLRPAPGWLAARGSVLDRLQLGLAAVFIGLALWCALAPELFFDSLVYHLAVPARWILAGRIESLPHNFFSNFPMNVEMLYTGALLLADERLCRLLHVGFGVLAALAAFALGRRWFGRRAGLWAGTWVLMVPVVSMNMQVSGVDVASAFFAVLAVHALMTWALTAESEHAGASRQPWLAGVLAGAALASKYTAILVLAPAAAALFWAAWRRRRPWPDLFKAALGLALGAVAVLLPWLVKSAAFTGNPVYPFLYQWIPSAGIDPAKMAQQMGGFKEYGQRTWVQWLRQPWDLTFMFPTGNSFVGAGFLWLFPGMLALAAGWRRAAPSLRVLLLTALGAGLLWSSQTQITRYFIAAFPVVTLIGAVVLDRWDARSPWLGRLGRAGLVGFSLWAWALTATMLASNLDPAGVNLGLQSREDYLGQKMMNSYAPMAAVINGLPADAKVLLTGETRTYYFSRRVDAATVYDDHPLIEWLARLPTAGKVWEALRAAGYTHVTVHFEEAARVRGYEPYRWTPEALARWRELVARYLKRVATRNEISLYEVRAQPDPAAVIKPGRPIFTFDPEAIRQFMERQAAANAFFSRGQAAEAIAQAKELAALVPGSEIPCLTLAWIYQSLGKNDETLAMYREADRMSELSAGAYNNLGVQYLQHGLGHDAWRYFLLAAQLDPTLAVARENLKRTEDALQSK